MEKGFMYGLLIGANSALLFVVVVMPYVNIEFHGFQRAVQVGMFVLFEVLLFRLWLKESSSLI